ncbi:MAG: tRNA-modifying protein YgfZ [Burkholderiaceae bacterium]|nr:tRNA-modifying protein YgfZ [Burkholderiaceae bacterium]
MDHQFPPSLASGGSVRLTDWALLRAHGADAATFLQGQLTQDVSGMSADEMRLGGYCSPKGRLLASFVIWRMGSGEFGLVCSADVAAAVRKRLSMYILRARCRIDEANSQWAVFGVAGRAVAGDDAPAPWRARQRDGGPWWLGMPVVDGVPRWLLVQPVDAPPPAGPGLEPGAWGWLEVTSGVPRITAATSEQFVPQMINFELVGGVHFQKGCYPGQEVVARSQYRGTIKRRLHLFATAGSALPGQELFHSQDPSQPAGMVVNAAAIQGLGTRVLAEVKLGALDDGSLHLGSPEGAQLQQLPLPYSVPELAHA